MTTFYLDFEGGNDANDGTTFANRWKTFASGATAARIAPGDTIRIMASPDETLVGNAIWTQYSKTITLPGAVTATISDCETAWTPSTNVTIANSTTNYKEGTKSVTATIATAFTTGKVAYFATGALNLSAYQQVSFWCYTNASAAAGVFSLRLCSDTTGDVPVHTISIPTASGSVWTPVTVDLGTNLSASVQSISLYANSDPGSIAVTLDNIIACKASSSPDSLTHNSLIGKVHNRCWAASTTYATGDIRKPSQPNRNGFRYQVTAGGGGSSGASEPTWPTYIGGTVTDGALTWTCEGLEDTWYAIQSISGTTVRIDQHPGNTGTGGRGYAGASETVATYKREPIKFTLQTSQTVSLNLVQDSGTDGSPITFSGGWNRTDMSTQTGETWITAQNGNAYLYSLTQSWIALENCNGVRGYYGLRSDKISNILRNVHINHCGRHGISAGTAVPIEFQCVRGGSFCHNADSGVSAESADVIGNLFRVSLNSNVASGLTESGGYNGRIHNVDAKNNGSYGLNLQYSRPTWPICRLTTGNNASAGILVYEARLTLMDCLIPETTEFQTISNDMDVAIFSHNHDRVAGAHLITCDGGTIVSATDQRHTASGFSWKFRPTSTTVRHSAFPLRLSVAKIAVVANTTATLSIWTRRSTTNIKGKMMVPGGYLSGIPVDVSVACEPVIDTWTQYTLSLTPTETGVIEVFFMVSDAVGTTASYWIDDFAVT